MVMACTGGVHQKDLEHTPHTSEKSAEGDPAMVFLTSKQMSSRFGKLSNSETQPSEMGLDKKIRLTDNWIAICR